MEDLKPLIRQIFAPQKDERVIILNDFPEDDLSIDNDMIARRHFARKWHKDFLELSKKNRTNVEEIITFEPTGTNNKPLPKKAMQKGEEINLQKRLDSLGKKDIVLAITKFSATAPLKKRTKKQNFRLASMPGVTEEMTAFNADYKNVAKKAEILAKKLSEATGANIEFSTGNKVFFDLRGKVQGHADKGDFTKPGNSGNLPAGEAYTCPYEGFDKKLGKSLSKGEIPVHYGEEKVVFNIDNNQITDVIGLGPKAEEMRRYFKEDKGRRHIAELGLGCNDKAEFCGKTIQDEKIEGMHFAYGYNAHFGGEIDETRFDNKENIVHQDIVYSLYGKIHVERLELLYEDKKEIILKEGQYVEGLFDR